ncbi:cysteine desulfurase [Candidatus Woesearchaeota archaeon]|nr:MAG: cysteine desulfurase [Candidatus Woesearchaeota archaeon]
MNVEKLREDFPILKKPIIYFDSACMSLKPRQVIEKVSKYYTDYTACAGRSSHKFAHEVEIQVAGTRKEVKCLINAKRDSEIIFSKNTTESINLIANSFGLKPGDEVIISDKEHNSNLLPWLKLAKKGIKVVPVESNEDNTFNINNFEKAFTENTKLVSVVHTSNMDGVTNPVKEIVKIAHNNNAAVLVDAAQSVPSKEVDVQSLGVDFLAFSGHKALGPTGTGVLYGKKEMLEKLDQFLMGGETVVDSTYTGYEPEELPARFEAGLQNYAGIIGLGEACKYLKKVGLKNISRHEFKLNKMLSEAFADNEKISILGPKDPEQRAGIFSFIVSGMDIHDVSGMLSASRNIMLRSGAHCVHSWFNKRGLKGSVRASMYLYNTEEEAQAFIDELNKILKF